jgi:hypothetical protein
VQAAATVTVPYGQGGRATKYTESSRVIGADFPASEPENA